MLAILGLLLTILLTMFGLITWVIPNLVLCMGDEGVGPLSPTYGKAIHDRRYKLYHIWATIGAIGCISGIILTYVACYWLT